MKKFILLFLLIPLGLFSQNIEIQQSWIDLPQDIKVGDIITYQVRIGGQASQQIDIQYLNLDLSYNKYKLTKIENIIWDGRWQAVNKSHNHWSNYYYNSDRRGTNPNDLDLQYDEGLSGKYEINSDWNIYRAFIQSTQDLDGVIFSQKFRVEDISNTSYSDFSEMVKLNWARILDRNNNRQTNIVGNPRILGLEQVGGSPAGTVNIQLESPNTTIAQDYFIHFYDEIEIVDTDGDGLTDYKIPAAGATPVLSGNLDASGKFITDELKLGVEYFVNTFVPGDYNSTTNQTTYPDWVNDIVTVSDVYLTFLQANGGGIEGEIDIFEYEIQEELANISSDIRNNGGTAKEIDLDDSYALLAHLTGVLDNAADQNNTSSTAEFYPITSMINGTFNNSKLVEYWGKNNNNRENVVNSNIIKLNSIDPITINLAHGFMGDADLSHSTEPILDESTSIIRSQVFNGFEKGVAVSALEPSTADADIFTQKVEDRVELTVQITKEDLSGLQLNMRYDDSVLEFDNITFNTGNTMTNFAKEVGDRLIIGAIDPSGYTTITPGVIITLSFKTKRIIDNTAGLVSFYVTDAVESNGRKVNLKIK